MSRRPSHAWPTWPVLAVALLLLLAFVRWWSLPHAHTPVLPVAGQPQPVARAVDGDTLLLASGHRVRLIGVDTPETKHPDRPAEPGGPEAAEFTRQRVANRSVLLQYDRERVDQYGRVLAYVTVGDELLNESLIRAGWSAAETSFPYRADMQRRFRAAEAAARSEELGLWSRSIRATSPPAVAP